MTSYIFTTAFGYVAILFQTDPYLLKRIFLPHLRKRELDGRVRRTGPLKPESVPAVLGLSKEIRAYFAGNPIEAHWELLDLTGMTPLQHSVLEAVGRVPYGKARSYGQIAAQVGHPGAYRFVGSTLARNPFPVLIPCHRIIRADGSPGLFQGGRDLKKGMLELEKGLATPGRPPQDGG